ncbi:hypothetical protein YC2023_070763 [Brassica napus]
MGRWLWLNGMCCHHVCFVVSSNHKQTKGSLCRRDFGSVESGAIYMVIWWLARCFYRKRGFIWYLFMATTSIARFNLNGRKRGFSTWSIIRLGPRLICLFIKFTHKLVLHPIGLRAVNVCMGVIDSTMEGGLMESDGAPHQRFVGSTFKNCEKCQAHDSNRFLKTGIRHSIFQSLRLGRSSQSIASGLLRF